MITKAQIIRLASLEGVPAKTVERDYVLAHVVAAIAQSKEDKGSMLVFKGGSALRLCHVEGYRYSADLDFSVVGGSVEDALGVIARALGATGGSVAGLRLTDGVPPRIAYLGPLGRERTLKLDLADDEVVFHTERRVLLQRWPDLPADASVLVYTLLEIAAEKLRCVLQRLQCRDLLDLHLLFEMDVDPVEAAELFRPKAQQRRLDPATFPSRYRERLGQYQKRWDAELREHVPGSLPHFGEIERRVSRYLRRAGLI